MDRSSVPRTSDRLSALYYTHDELEVLRHAVQEQLDQHTMGEPAWTMLNSLRTSLSEAMYDLQRHR